MLKILSREQKERAHRTDAIQNHKPQKKQKKKKHYHYRKKKKNNDNLITLQNLNCATLTSPKSYKIGIS